MAKTTPLKILVVGPSRSEIWNDSKIKKLIEKGDSVEVLDIEADMLIGENAYRSFPKTIQFTIVAINAARKRKAGDDVGDHKHIGGKGKKTKKPPKKG